LSDLSIVPTSHEFPAINLAYAICIGMFCLPKKG